MLYDKALEDITQGKRTDRGARGMSSEQVVWCTILMRMPGLIYKKLSFHLADSESFKEFARIHTLYHLRLVSSGHLYQSV